jgi:hypothetical protein
VSGLFFRPKTISTSEPAIGAMRVQTSVSGIGVPLVFGKTRITTNMIWYGDFIAIPHTETTTSGGKGGGKQKTENTTFTYQVAVAFGLCEGPIADVGTVWRGDAIYSPIIPSAETVTVLDANPYIPDSPPYEVTVPNSATYSADLGVNANIAGLGYEVPMTDVSPGAPTSLTEYSRSGGTYTFYAGHGTIFGLFIDYQYINYPSTITALSQLGLSLFSGAIGQSPWGYLTTYHPGEALGYSGLAYVASGSYDLGGSANMENHSFEVTGFRPFSISIRDANPRDVVVDFLSAERYGAGFPAAKIADLSGFANWCTANSLFVSPAYIEQREAREYLMELVSAVGCEFVWSEGLLKIIPYGDSAVTGNGVTYTPNTTPAYDLSDDDFLVSGDEDPVIITRKATADAYNATTVEFVNRANQYNVQPVTAQDLGHIEAHGLRQEDPQRLHLFTEQSAAQLSAQMRLQRRLYIRNTYKFRLGWRYARLERMDIVTITDIALGIDRLPVRITEIEEDEDGELAILAEDMPQGVLSAARYSSQVSSGFGGGSNGAPGSVLAPLIFEPPLDLTGGSNQIWLAVSGSSSEWGGCHVWVSYDGTSYSQVGTLYGPARYGALQAVLAAPSAQPDISNTATVDLTTDGQLLSGSDDDVNNDVTLCYVGGELFAYKTATLASYRRYSLSYLRRGLYGSPAGAHSAGAAFARLDQAVFKYVLPATAIGKSISLKLTSFNVRGEAAQSLSEAAAYSYSIQGAAPSGPADLALQSPFTGTLFVAQWAVGVGASSYTVEIWSQAALQRTINTTATQASYTLENAIADGGPWRDFTVKVATVANGQTSGFSQINISNTVPAAPTGISTGATTSSVTISWAAVADTDFQDYQVWLDTTDGFTPGPSTLVYTGTDLTTTITGLTTATTYYLRLAARDKWGAGALAYSAQQTQVTT